MVVVRPVPPPEIADDVGGLEPGGGYGVRDCAVEHGDRAHRREI